MKILGIDSSAKTVSAAVCDGYKIIASGFIDAGITHSETMLPLIESILEAAKLKLSEIDAFAVTTGPGSFTGVRIAVSAVKGMSMAESKPVFPVSSLEGLGYNLLGMNCVAVPVMDARRNQVYNALFRAEGDKIIRITEDRVISVAQLSDELTCYKDERIMILGDGAELLDMPEHTAPPLLKFQNAASACFAALDKTPVTAAKLMPFYLRLSQAERERLNNSEKLNKGEKR